MNTWNVCSIGLLILLMQVGWSMAVKSQESITDDLPKIGPAPDFTLTTQDGKKLSLKSLAGKVVAVTFIYASCADTCPILTTKMVGLQSRLGSSFGSKVNYRGSRP